MANPFTETQTRYIFEALETPYSSSYNVLDGMGVIGALTDISNGSTGQAQTQILAWLAGMDATSVSMVKTQVIPEWVKVRVGTANVQNGSVGSNSVTGVNYDPIAQRKQVQSLMQTYIPFFKFHEVIARRAGTQNSLSVPTMW